MNPPPICHLSVHFKNDLARLQRRALCNSAQIRNAVISIAEQQSQDHMAMLNEMAQKGGTEKQDFARPTEESLPRRDRRGFEGELTTVSRKGDKKHVYHEADFQPNPGRQIKHRPTFLMPEPSSNPKKTHHQAAPAQHGKPAKKPSPATASVEPKVRLRVQKAAPTPVTLRPKTAPPPDTYNRLSRGRQGLSVVHPPVQVPAPKPSRPVSAHGREVKNPKAHRPGVAQLTRDFQAVIDDTRQRSVMAAPLRTSGAPQGPSTKATGHGKNGPRQEPRLPAASAGEPIRLHRPGAPSRRIHHE